MSSMYQYLIPEAIESKSLAKNREEIKLGPFKKGFGNTLVVALRRILLAYINTGCAVVEVSINGVLHEYATLEGMQEDVMDVLLNLREAAFNITSSRNEVTLALRKTNFIGPIRLEDIDDIPQDVEVMNPEHVIAHITQKRDFNMTLKVRRGSHEDTSGSDRGENNTDLAKDIDMLQISHDFNPILSVKYEVKPTRVGGNIELDEVILDIETDGTITPGKALSQAGLILSQPLNAIIHLHKVDKPEIFEENKIDPILLKPIETLVLKSTRASNCLKSEGIHLIGDLVTRTEESLLLTPNLGKRSLEEIKTALLKLSLTLGTTVPNWPPENVVYPSVDQSVSEE